MSNLDINDSKPNIGRVNNRWFWAVRYSSRIAFPLRLFKRPALSFHPSTRPAPFTPTLHTQMSPSSSVSEEQYGPDMPNRKRSSPPPTKRIKSNFPPQFWDRLSKVWLTPRALREKDRRNGVRPPATVLAASVVPTTLVRFARHGGPDLGHLRGYPGRRDTAPSSRRTQVTAVSAKASADDKDFALDLINHGIYPEGFEHGDGRSTPEPDNLDVIIRDLARSRASLSPSRFSTSAFKKFKRANNQVISKRKVITGILPIICGSSDILDEGDIPFVNLDSIAGSTTAKPDLYDGSHAKELSKTVRQGLNKTIVPTSYADALVAPNFFLEAQAPCGGADVAKRKACLDGAIGARVMHSLQSYGEYVSAFDGNAHSFSATYHAGTAEGERPKYHMTQLKAYALINDREAFAHGAAALRNTRDLARRQRVAFIQAANARASKAELAATADKLCNMQQDDEQDDDQEVEQVDEQEDDSPSKSSAWQDYHDDLQQHIAKSCVEEREGDSEAPTTPQYYYARDSSQGLDPDVASRAGALSMSSPCLRNPVVQELAPFCRNSANAGSDTAIAKSGRAAGRQTTKKVEERN
ncbi:hypothetical protein A9K55_006341 [Cordyceps militaris]|uniref:Uncharacterized protein n=1 Tax=Cordyceps militaris TaxID=73501 RepID=A0A2H4SCV6_CORMI|nr:hypothetical protein A9K55_006341 [Cordyceps militaris]